MIPNREDKDIEDRAHSLIIHAYFRNPGATVRVRGFDETRDGDRKVMDVINKILIIIDVRDDFEMDWGRMTIRYKL